MFRIVRFIRTTNQRCLLGGGLIRKKWRDLAAGGYGISSEVLRMLALVMAAQILPEQTPIELGELSEVGLFTSVKALLTKQVKSWSVLPRTVNLESKQS